MGLFWLSTAAFCNGHTGAVGAKNTAPKTAQGPQALQRVTAETTPPHKAYGQPAL